MSGREGMRQIQGFSRRFWTILASPMLLTLAAECAVAIDLKSDFPRLGGMNIGTTPYDGYADPAYHAELAKLDYVVLGGNPQAMTKYAKEIKKLNPDIILGKYTNIAAVRNRDNAYTSPMMRKLSSEQGPNNTNAKDWWLRDFDGNKVSGASHGNVRANITDWVKPDANGDYWPEYRAKYDFDYWMKDPVWDVWYSDVGNWAPKFQNRGFIGDFSGGKETERHVIDKAWRKGHRRHWDAIRKLRPDVLIAANHNWYLYQHNNRENWNLGVFENQINGGFLEHIMGPTSRFEFTKGWDRLYEAYRWSEDYFVDPVVLIFNVIGPTDNYQFFRYAFATCLLGNAFFDYSPDGANFYGTVEWFDEYDRAGSDRTNWMGEPFPGSAFPEKDWQKGVYRRDFDNAVVLVNPRGNGAKTVEVEAGLRHLEGQQDPGVNTGRVAGNIKLADGDGIVLVREEYLMQPNTPGIKVRK